MGRGDICLLHIGFRQLAVYLTRNIMQIMKNVCLQFTSSSQYRIPPLPYIQGSQSVSPASSVCDVMTGQSCPIDSEDQSPVSTVATHAPG